MTQSKVGPYRLCPGVPALNHQCTRKIRTREICPDCERTARAGRIVGDRRCPGVSPVGHVCSNRVRSRRRCKTCEEIYDKHQDVISGFKRDKIERKCLRCNKKFIAVNRFLRLCKYCRTANLSTELSGVDEGRYSINIRQGRS
jgi:hypothetical protein